MDTNIREKRYGLIEQTCGIGDIFYIQKIAKLLIERGVVEKIIWPVEDVYNYLDSYMGTNLIKYIPVSDFVDPTGLFKTKVNPLGYTITNTECIKVENLKYDSIESDNPTHWLYIPFLNSDRKFSGSVMKAKYKFVNMDGEWGDWDEYFEFRRNEEKENQLMDYFDIKPDDEYVVIGDTYGTPPKTATKKIKYSSSRDHTDTQEKKIIKIRSIEGYSVFDWCKVFENASEIHMIETSFLYILEKINLKGSVFNLYSKWKPSFWGHIEHIPKKVKWNFCNW